MDFNFTRIRKLFSSQRPDADGSTRGIDQDQVLYLETFLHNFMVQRKPFLSNHYSLYQLAEETGISMAHLHFIIDNPRYGSFRNFIDSYRIGYCKQLLERIPPRAVNLFDLSVICGYNDQHEFSRAFKRFMHISAAEYLRRFFRAKNPGGRFGSGHRLLLLIVMIAALHMVKCQNRQLALAQMGRPVARPGFHEAVGTFMKKTIVSLLIFFLLVTFNVHGQPLNIRDRMIYDRALEAVIWGMPAVNYDLMLKEMLDKKLAKQNEVIFWSRPVDWHNQTLTPNPDAIYFMIFFNTKDVGPVVIDVPPADGASSFAGNIDNVFQMPLEDAGPYGADKGAGGKYLILPPGYRQKTPGSYIVLAADTYEGYALLRSNLVSHKEPDIIKAVAYGKRLKVYPLSKAQSTVETKFSDAKNILYESTIPYDLNFFRSLDRIVQSQLWLTRDKIMIDQLRTIGIEKGKPFHPDAKTEGILNMAAKAAHEYIEVMYDAGFPRLNSDAHWAVPAMPDLVKAGSSGYAENDIYPVDARCLTYALGYVGIKRLGKAQIYLISSKDKDDMPLNGAKTYRLHVPPNVPTRQYWSATIYDRNTHALIKNMAGASRASNDDAVRKNPDGSIDVYFAPQAPMGKESNWIPTDRNGQFEVLFRLYGPEKALFDRTWKLGDIEKVR